MRRLSEGGVYKRADFILKTKMEENEIICQLNFAEIESILLNCLPRPRIGALHIPQVISSFDSAPELTEIDLKKNNYFYQLHADRP